MKDDVNTTLPVNVFKDVFALLAVKVFKAFIDDVTEPVTKYLKSNELVSCEEPLIVPAGVAEILPLATYLVSNDDVNWDEELIAPLNDVKYDDVAEFKFEIDVTKLAVEILAV